MYPFPGNEFELIYRLENPNNYPLWINNCGRTAPFKNFHFTRRFSNIAAVEYVISGKGVIEVNGKSHIVHAGDTYILPNELSYTCYSDFSDPLKKIYIVFEGVLAYQLIDIYKLKNKMIFRDTNTQRYIESIHEICTSDLSADEIHRQCTLQFTDLIIFLHQSHIKATLQNEFSTMEYLMLYIKNHLFDDLTVDDLAKLSNFNKDYLIRIFKKKFNQTPYQYIICEKIKLACALLSSTHKSISQIASELNWHDAHNFTRIFKNKVGISPSEYRNAHLSVPPDSAASTDEG